MQRKSILPIVFILFYFTNGYSMPIGEANTARRDEGTDSKAANVSMETLPFEPTNHDSIHITIYGSWPFSGMQVYDHKHSVNDTIITIDLWLGIGNSDRFIVAENVAPLSTGRYRLKAFAHDLSGSYLLVEGRIKVFPFKSPSLSWGNARRLTENNVSDSAPAVAVHHNALQVLWTYSYEGEIHRITLDDSGWHGRAIVADCPTGSGASVVSFRNRLYAIYPQGNYPVFHLFGKSIDPDSVQFPLTSGEVFDEYGGSAVVYRDTLYVFWKRWIGGPRYVLYKIFDTQSWSDELTVTEDDYYDSRPATTVFHDTLYLFYHGGAHFRFFSGTNWSEEIKLIEAGVDGNTAPAACSFGNNLYIFFCYGKEIYYKVFDGTSWHAATRIPITPIDEARDLAVAVRNDSLYLFWGSHYSRQHTELYYTVAHQLTSPVTHREQDILPTSFGLQQNYPNPFSTATQIGYVLPRSSHVTLTLYDMLGRKIAVLVDELKAAGEYRVHWDANGLTSGSYFYKLEAGGFFDVRKLSVVK